MTQDIVYLGKRSVCTWKKKKCILLSVGVF